MCGYMLANGSMLTEEDIERIDNEFTNGSWEGTLADISDGPGRSPEDERTISLQLPESVLLQIDKLTEDRDEFIHAAIMEKLASA